MFGGTFHQWLLFLLITIAWAIISGIAVPLAFKFDYSRDIAVTYGCFFIYIALVIATIVFFCKSNFQTIKQLVNSGFLAVVIIIIGSVIAYVAITFITALVAVNISKLIDKSKSKKE